MHHVTNSIMSSWKYPEILSYLMDIFKKTRSDTEHVATAITNRHLLLRK